MSTIEIKNLTKRYGEAEVLSNINMKLESGKIYGLVGRNGSGKTMLMKHILGFVKATQGTILINGKVVGENDDMQKSGRKVFVRYAPTSGIGAGIDGKSRYFAVR